MFIEADTHCHTVASTHAYSTVLEIANTANEYGLKGVAITDHTIGGPDAPHLWHFHNLKRAIPRKIGNVTLIFGCETNIMKLDGTLDMEDKELKKLEWVIASMHNTIMQNGSYHEITECYLKVAENDNIDVIGHCATAEFEFDYEKVLPVFKEKNIFVELNESYLSRKPKIITNYDNIIEICKKEEIPMVLNTDSHFCLGIGKVEKAEELLRKHNFPFELIANKNFEIIKKHIEEKHGKIF